MFITIMINIMQFFQFVSYAIFGLIHKFFVPQPERRYGVMENTENKENKRKIHTKKKKEKREKREDRR